MIKHLVGALLLVGLLGCSYKEHNEMIAKANASRIEAVGTALAQQTTEGGRLAVSILFATGANMQDFKAPESAKDYMIAGVPLTQSIFSGISSLLPQDASIHAESGSSIYYDSSFGANSFWNSLDFSTRTEEIITTTTVAQ